MLLPHLPKWTAARRAAAAAYRRLGLGEHVRLPVETVGAEACYHLYVARTGSRDQLVAALSDAGIGARAYYTIPLHRQPALSAYAADEPLTEVDGAAAECLALPMGPGLTESQVEVVVQAVGEAVSGAPDRPIRAAS